jgi:hypothetical protein
MFTQYSNLSVTFYLFRVALVFGLFFIGSSLAFAASLNVSPNTGVYTSNSTFTVRVVVNSAGAPINAAEGTLSFNPRELSVVSVSRSSSIFNLWVTEPTFSNSAGTVNFSGGLPSGYTGAAGTIMSVTFRTIGSGTARLNFSSASVLANDGRGTNVLSGMNGGSYTIQAASTAPAAEEVIVEYVAPANTPAAPVITSSTHPDSSSWYVLDEAILNWKLPPGVTSVRTLLDTSPTTVPTRVYDTPINTITIGDLSEGVSYFHLQFKNEDGWGKIAHYRLGVDTERPTAISITQAPNTDLNNPQQILVVTAEDESSSVERFMIKVDGAEPFEYLTTNASNTIPLPALLPGYHVVIIEAFDQAGNSIIGNYSFNIEAFEAPEFTEYPTEINEEVIPVLKGITRPNSVVSITLQKVGAEPAVYEVRSDESGAFAFIPDGRFTTGVYELTARATDEYGAVSNLSTIVKIAVQQPGFIRIGTLLVSVLSVIIPLIILTIATIIGGWYLVQYFRRFRKQVGVESAEALDILRREFSSLQSELRQQETLIVESRKTKKLTKAESDMIQVLDMALQNSQRKVEKEIQDVKQLVN